MATVTFIRIIIIMITAIVINVVNTITLHFTLNFICIEVHSNTSVCKAFNLIKRCCSPSAF